MTKLKHEAQLLRKALEVAEKYASNRGYASFRQTPLPVTRWNAVIGF